MALFAIPESQLYGDILYDVVNETNITRASPGSKTRALIQAITKKMGKQYRKFDANIALSFLSVTEGRYLEFIGDMMGVGRLGAKPAFSSANEQNVKFYVDVGTFGSINSGGAITIPAGTIISSGSAGNGILYKVAFTTILSSSVSEAFVAVEAFVPGPQSNVGPKQLIFHSFTDYTQANSDTLKVTNNGEIVTGQDIESDTNYRFRISNQVLAAEAGNEISIRLAALAVPGVADVVYLPYFRGLGTFELLIKSTTSTVSSSLISAVDRSVQAVTSAGNIGHVRGPVETGFSTIMTLTLRTRLAEAEQTSIVNTVINNTSLYVNGLDIGEDFIVNELIERVMASSNQIKNVGC
jgi:uncharacterized phage protein gp47/JayE